MDVKPKQELLSLISTTEGSTIYDRIKNAANHLGIVLSEDDILEVEVTFNDMTSSNRQTLSAINNKVNKMKSLSQHINEAFETAIFEGFVIDDDKLYFKHDEAGFINTKFGKYATMKPYEGKLQFGRFYAAYSKDKNNIDKAMYDEVLRAIKGKSTKLTLDTASYFEFLSRTATYLVKVIRTHEIDTIIKMDSSSNLVTDLVNELNRRLPRYFTVHTYDKVLFKNPNVEEIFIDPEASEKLNSQMKTIINDLKRIHELGEFSIKDIKLPQTRKFFRNWLKLKDNFNQHIMDKNVCIVDDYVTSGATMNEASKLLEECGAKKVVGLCIMKG